MKISVRGGEKAVSVSCGNLNECMCMPATEVTHTILVLQLPRGKRRRGVRSSHLGGQRL